MGQWFEGYRTNTGSYDNPTNKWLAIYDDAASVVRTHPCWWSSKWRGWEENMFCVLVAQIGCEWSSDKALSCQSPNRTTGNKERAINKTRRSGGAMGPILGVNTLLRQRTTTPRRTMSLQERRSWGEEVQKEREVDWGQMRATCQRLDYMHCHPPRATLFGPHSKTAESKNCRKRALPAPWSVQGWILVAIPFICTNKKLAF